MTYHQTLSTCRFCGKTNYDETRFRLIKYGVRHYAHPDCALEKLGVAFLSRLNLWQLESFPYRAAQQFGLLPELEKLLDETRARRLEHEARLRTPIPSPQDTRGISQEEGGVRDLPSSDGNAPRERKRKIRGRGVVGGWVTQ